MTKNAEDEKNHPFTKEMEEELRLAGNEVMRIYFESQPPFWETELIDGKLQKTGRQLVPVDRWGNKY